MSTKDLPITSPNSSPFLAPRGWPAGHSLRRCRRLGCAERRASKSSDSLIDYFASREVAEQAHASSCAEGASEHASNLARHAHGEAVGHSVVEELGDQCGLNLSIVLEAKQELSGSIFRHLSVRVRSALHASRTED